MGHWYGEQGEPVYEIKKSKGEGLRPTTIADARKLNLVPSVTTILAMIDKPALTRWKLDQLLKAVLARPFDDVFDDIEYWTKDIYSASQREGREAAEAGNKIHNSLESYYNGEGFHRGTKKFCQPVVDLLQEEFGDLEWIAEASFKDDRGFGGKCDLHYKAKNGLILDFKTKSTANFARVKAYDEHCMQLAAYREGFDIPKAKCYNVFISTKEPGQVKLHKWTEKECQRAFKMFSHILEYWKLANNFS